MLKTILKIAIAIGILYWLISQGKLDFSLIGESFRSPKFFIISSILVSLQLLIGAYRLGFLLKIKSQNIRGRNLISAQWIGQLFSTVLPGAFTSDILKVGYIKKVDQNLSRSYILFSILIDRIIGLNSLLLIAGISSLIFYSKLITLNPMVEKIILLNIILFVLSLLGMSLIFLKTEHQNKLLKFVPTQKLKSMASEVWVLSEYKLQFFWAYLASILGHMLSLTAFWVINYPFFEHPISLEYITTLIPIGHIAVVIPISPGGVGVGHAAFATLFQFINHSNGASLYNVYWIMCLIINLFGIIPFVFDKKVTTEKKI